MKLVLDAPDSAFEAEVRAFVAAHWQADAEVLGRTDGLHAELDAAAWTPPLRRWFDALVTRGWSVPYWRRAQGGTDWGPVRRYVFQRVLAETGAPLPLNCSTGIVGPVLLNEPPSADTNLRLEQIRRFEVRWSIAASEPHDEDPLAKADVEDVSIAGSGAPERTRTVAVPVGTGFRLSGRKTWVSGGLHADLLLVRAEIAGANRSGWFVVPANAAGVRSEAVPMMGSSHALARFEFVDVPVPRRDLLRHDPKVPLPEPPLRIRSSRLKKTLDGLRSAADASDEPADRSAADSLLIQVASLEALELRQLLEHAEIAQRRGMASVLAIRGAEIGQAVAALRARMLGYHAVPFPDDLKFHNEGVFGDETALPAVRQALFDRAFSVYAAERPGDATSIEALKDRMAREIFGF